ncbi:hypothetical protein FEM03_11500 [Phragmitibacter flavus]|uniref:DUF1795 domain-containing protein n=1 Tax=Phragmitibacter flavus TaxID=2576071 RepID=A0A5R8KDH5_9BACT|nr:hypothetical protein [Phragmitibacter flavus]TLD70353.1 hypothetical protein FEM03_11500 [Phragmitibacter flavus]
MKTIALPLLALCAVLLPFTASQAEEPAKKITVGEFNFTLAAPWQEAENTGMMTKAIIEHPIKDAVALKAMFYHFGSGQGGAVEANINRWIGQFEGTPEVKRDEQTIDGVQVVILTATGTYLDGPPMGGNKTPRPDYQMLASILVGKDAPVFIKLTGPKASTESIHDAFKKLTVSPFEK